MSAINSKNAEFPTWRKQFDRVVVKDAGGTPVSVKGHIVATRFATLQAYELGTPVYVFLSFCNANRVVFRYENDLGTWSETKPLGRDVVSLPEAYVADFNIDVIDALRPR